MNCLNRIIVIEAISILISKFRILFPF